MVLASLDGRARNCTFELAGGTPRGRSSPNSLRVGREAVPADGTVRCVQGGNQYTALYSTVPPMSAIGGTYGVFLAVLTSEIDTFSTNATIPFVQIDTLTLPLPLRIDPIDTLFFLRLKVYINRRYRTA